MPDDASPPYFFKTRKRPVEGQRSETAESERLSQTDVTPLLGAVRAGDREALITARAVLEQGGLLIVFPEGTRIDGPDAVGSPHDGAGRLAVETGAPIVPAAILGTSHLWLGPVP